MLAHTMLLADVAADAANDSSLGHYLLVLGLLLVTMSLLMRLRRRHKKRSIEPTPHESLERMRQMRGMRGDLEDLMVEIEQLAKRFGAQLDAKTVQLEQLLVEADAKIERLHTVQSRVSDRQDTSTHTASPGTDATPSDIPDDPVARSVYELADAGNNSAEIARALNEHVGKVELILALRGAGREKREERRERREEEREKTDSGHTRS